MARRDMRLVEVMLLSKAARREVVAILEEEDLDYNVSDRSDGENASALAAFPLPAHAVEPIQERFAELDAREEMYTVVHNPEAIVSDRFVDTNETTGQRGALAPGRISRRELHSKAADMLPDFVIFTILTSISAVTATAGIMLQSLSVLIGAMVIAPLLGPVISTSVATVVDDRTLFGQSVRYQLKGSAVALLASVTFAWFSQSMGGVIGYVDIHEALSVSQYTAPAFLLVTIAVGGGIAGAISLSTSGSTELVGVMVAAAIMPAFAAAGVALAWSQPIVVMGSLGVALMNMFALNLSAVVTLWYLGYQPNDWNELKRTRSVLLRRGAVLVGLIVALALFLTHLGAETTLRTLLHL